MLQLWLLTATMNACWAATSRSSGRRRSRAWAAFGLNFGLLRFYLQRLGALTDDTGPRARRVAVERSTESSRAIFALVMATGIVSLAAHGSWASTDVAQALFWLNVGLYAVLWVLTLLARPASPGRLVADLSNHAAAPGFFTLVAGTVRAGQSVRLLTSWLGVAARALGRRGSCSGWS